MKKCEFIGNYVRIKGSLFRLDPKDKGRVFEYEEQKTIQYQPGTDFYIVTDSVSYPFLISATFMPSDFNRCFRIVAHC